MVEFLLGMVFASIVFKLLGLIALPWLIILIPIYPIIIIGIYLYLVIRQF